MSFYRTVIALLLLVGSASAVDSLEYYSANEATDIYSAQATTNFGTATSITVLSRPAPSRNRDIILRVDTTGMAEPTNYELKVCSLCLWATGGINGQTVDLYRVYKDWVETEATWNIWSTGNDWGLPGGLQAVDTCCDNAEDDAGADRAVTKLDSRSTSTAWANTWQCFDVDTALANAWVRTAGDGGTNSDTIDAGVGLSVDLGAFQVSIGFHSDDNDSVPYFKYVWEEQFVAGLVGYRHVVDSTYYKHRDSDAVALNYYRHQP